MWWWHCCIIPLCHSDSRASLHPTDLLFHRHFLFKFIPRFHLMHPYKIQVRWILLQYHHYNQQSLLCQAKEWTTRSNNRNNDVVEKKKVEQRTAINTRHGTKWHNTWNTHWTEIQQSVELHILSFRLILGKFYILRARRQQECWGFQTFACCHR